MKNKIITLLLITTSLFSCTDTTRDKLFEGYIVAKEYTPEHMSNECEKTVSYAIVVPHVSRSSPPRKIAEKWVWYIANKDQVLSRTVSEETFHSRKCGERVVILKDTLLEIK